MVFGSLCMQIDNDNVNGDGAKQGKRFFQSIISQHLSVCLSALISINAILVQIFLYHLPLTNCFFVLSFLQC